MHRHGRSGEQRAAWERSLALLSSLPCVVPEPAPHLAPPARGGGLTMLLRGCVVRDLRVVRFWSFPFNTFRPQLTTGNKLRAGGCCPPGEHRLHCLIADTPSAQGETLQPSAATPQSVPSLSPSARSPQPTPCLDLLCRAWNLRRVARAWRHSLRCPLGLPALPRLQRDPRFLPSQGQTVFLGSSARQRVDVGVPAFF